MGEIVVLEDNKIIKPLFLSVFGSRISDDMLKWKYDDKRGYNLAYIDEQEKLLGHIGAVYRNVAYKNLELSIPQMVDLMVSPQRPGGLSRGNSVFGLLSKHYMAHLQTEQNQQGVTFGFPSKRAMRAGEKLGFFGNVDSIYELEFGHAKGKWHTPKAIVADKSKAQEAIDILWPKMRQDFFDELIVVRDFSYLDYRYFSHPEYQYSCYLLTQKWSSKPFGVAFLKINEGCIELMDIVCSKKNIKNSISALQAGIADKLKKPIKIWLVDRYAKKFEKYASVVVKTEFDILANPVGADKIKGRWWLTSGDTEYR